MTLSPYLWSTLPLPSLRSLSRAALSLAKAVTVMCHTYQLESIPYHVMQTVFIDVTFYCLSPDVLHEIIKCLCNMPEQYSACGNPEQSLAVSRFNCMRVVFVDEHLNRVRHSMLTQELQFLSGKVFLYKSSHSNFGQFL